ncbi:glycoside hydrolase [Mycena galopus ATCC 62051]|nr:glycoside hydrolase [Mycena galopus ATCC 62051]
MSSPSSSASDASFILVGGGAQPRAAQKLGPATPHPSTHPAYNPGSAPGASYAHDWSPQGTGGGLRTQGRYFIDGYGRVCQLRGVNLGGACKTPANDDNATFPAGHQSVTFVGRPFPLEEAPEHLARLRRWGLTFVRFLVTWEAIEHEGPGIYDHTYLTYLRALLSLFPHYGLSAFVAMHQDVWARYAGGSGAPAWTLELVGLDLGEAASASRLDSAKPAASDLGMARAGGDGDKDDDDAPVGKDAGGDWVIGLGMDEDDDDDPYGERAVDGAGEEEELDHDNADADGAKRTLALEATGAAWLRGVRGGGHTEAERGLWPCGYQKLAAATMATLFWAGDTFAPKLCIAHNNNEVPVQQFLQNAFLGMWATLVRAVGDLEGVIGFEMMNEPHRGYVELKSLHEWDYNTDLHLGVIPSAFQSFQLGAGHPTTVPFYTRSFPMPTRKTSEVVLNKGRVKAWRADGPTKGECVWAAHGVWGWDTAKDVGVVLKENYFVKHPLNGKEIDWYTDFYFPFLAKWVDTVRSASPAAAAKIVFVEAIPNEFCPPSWTPTHRVPNMVYAPHWYDLNALFQKAFSDFTVNVQGLSRGMFPLRAFYWGHRGARDNFALQLRNIVQKAYGVLGETPVLVGECGVPMDMNKGEAFRTDDFTWQARMMDAMITGLERSLVGFTLWNYNSYNSDSLGDAWNGENFSWFSRRRALPPSLLYYEQDAISLDQGGRILGAVVRPYPAKTAGVPVRWEYEMTTGSFEFEWATEKEGKEAPSLTAAETEIYVPALLTKGRKLIVRGLGPDDRWVHDERRQTLFVVVPRSKQTHHRMEVSLHPPLNAAFELNDFWGDFGPRIVSLLVMIVGIVVYYFLPDWPVVVQG